MSQIKFLQIEVDIIKAFGWAIVELEKRLYHRLLQISASSSLISFEEFRRHLMMMEAKGYITSVTLEGQRAYKRLIVDSESSQPLVPRDPLDEMRLAIGSLQAQRETGEERRRGPLKVTKKIIIQSRNVGQEIVAIIENWLLEVRPREDHTELIRHLLTEMCNALKESKEAFLKYLDLNMPDIAVQVQHYLRSHGSEFLLLGMRLVQHSPM